MRKELKVVNASLRKPVSAGKLLGCEKASCSSGNCPIVGVQRIIDSGEQSEAEIADSVTMVSETRVVELQKGAHTSA